MELERVLLDVVGFLDERAVPYMVIGGYANLFWGRPRVTRDIDVTVRCPAGPLEEFVAEIGKRFQVLPRDPVGFAREHRVLPLLVGAVRVDMVLAGLPYEEEAIRRARTVEIGRKVVRICAPEDLIIHKVVSDRPQDREDVREIIRRQRGVLDRRYMDPVVQQLSTALERPDILSFYRGCFAELNRRRET